MLHRFGKYSLLTMKNRLCATLAIVLLVVASFGCSNLRDYPGITRTSGNLAGVPEWAIALFQRIPSFEKDVLFADVKWNQSNPDFRDGVDFEYVFARYGDLP